MKLGILVKTNDTVFKDLNHKELRRPVTVRRKWISDIISYCPNGWRSSEFLSNRTLDWHTAGFRRGDSDPCGYGYGENKWRRAEMGFKVFRLSIAWARIFPTGMERLLRIEIIENLSIFATCFAFQNVENSLYYSQEY